MTSPAKAIVLSSLGNLSLATALYFAVVPSGFNVHSGEIIIYMLLLLTGFLIVPSFLLMKAVRLVRSFEEVAAQSVHQKLAILMTAILGLGLGAVIVGIVWVIAGSH